MKLGKKEYVINWIDPIADRVSVTFGADPANPQSVPVDKDDPDSWAVSITKFYRREVKPRLDSVETVSISPLVGVPTELRTADTIDGEIK